MNFVDRLYNPNKYPVINNQDGSYSTHKMMSANIDGRAIAFPTIVYNNGELEQLKNKEAIDYALKNGEYIEFNTDEEANDFANNGYKRSFPNMR